MRAILFTSDLMLLAASQGIADRHGVRLDVADGAKRAVDLIDHTVGLLVIDLRMPQVDLHSLVPEVREKQLSASGTPGQARIVACGPHVHTDALEAAAAAGCDEVITRGQFDRRFDALLAKLTAPAEKDSEAR